MNYDLIVIGAGIQGAAVAQAAAADGYSVLVLEQFSEPARGTSCKSSKLIHGGLRYLETAQFALVKECLDERAYLLKNAPHLVRLVKFRIPIYEFTGRRPWQIFIGLSIYSLFSRKGFSRVPKPRWEQLDGLKTDQLRCVFSYYDAQTDDAHLTRSVLASAESMGCKTEFDATVIGGSLQDSGCTITYQQGDKSTQVSAPVVVNAAGPWVDRVAANIGGGETHRDIDLVAGTHIEVEGEIKEGMYYVEAHDGRVVFVMPWKGHTMIGTTEAPYLGDPAEIEPLELEIEYLITVYNKYFNRQLKTSDVINAWAGLRVLPVAKSSAFNRPRDTLMLTDRKNAPRVVSLYGGKLTAHRHMAQDLLKLVKGSLPDDRTAVADTKTLELPIVD